MQVEVKQALRDWFEAARKGSEGVSGTEVVDAVITLGLNYDYKQVHRHRTDCSKGGNTTHRERGLA